MELIAELEKEKRGVYAGAVGYFGYGSLSADGQKEEEGAMDTCIALRTMLVKEGVAYLQAGGGIVFDSDPYEEWVETMNKLGANMQCIKSAEEMYLRLQEDDGNVGKKKEGVNGDVVGKVAFPDMPERSRAHVDLAAG
ncbi:MAG: anthranilate synthase component 1 [Pleopsidium flavum]|nr:MAG: anthranilate synthase component 1 [Pleopsidium flavum]